MDRIEAMRALVAAVDGGSLSAAGRALGMPLATVSRKISELETLLNALDAVGVEIRIGVELQVVAAAEACVGHDRRTAARLERTNPDRSR